MSEEEDEYPLHFLNRSCPGLDPDVTPPEMAKNFTQAVSRFVSNGMPVVSRETFEKRHAACLACPKWDAKARMGMGKCRKCGCTKLKLWLETEKCPLLKW